uniref:Uncharacterized protein n=2 Tax=viral metagenome TaxID=1070528 RepID=A0A6H1ZWD5_9ZZZZ
MSNGENIFRQKFTRISGLSAIRRLPRLGKIRLGIKKVSAKTGKEYPFETDYFVCPPEIRKFSNYGDEPKELNISFPINDPEVIFPQCYKWYGSSKGLKCRGDGVNALRLNDDTNEMEEQNCPCDLLEEGKCKQRASLIFMMPEIAIGGVYQIDLSSYHSIVDINSGIDYARALLNDQIAFIPFKLKRVPKETHNEGKKQIHYTLQLELDVTAKQLQNIREGQKMIYGANRRYEIEAPKEDKNPAYDSKEDGAVIEEETEEETKAREAKDIADKEAVKKDIEESKTREADLKKAKEVGKTALRTPEKIRKLLEKRNAILDEIQTVARAYKVNTWREIVDIGERWNIFPKGLVASQVKQIVVDHPDKLKALLVAIKSDMEIADEDIPDRVGKLEVKNEEAPYPDERDEAEDFINDSDIPDLL